MRTVKQIGERLDLDLTRSLCPPPAENDLHLAVAIVWWHS
jgi:hypothetical protein